MACAARCSARTAPRGEATCSKKRSSPSGRTTLCSSTSAYFTSSIEQSVSEATAASNGGVRGRELLGQRVDDLHWDRGVGGGRDGQLAQVALGLAGEDLVDRGGVVAKFSPLPAPISSTRPASPPRS